MPKTPKRAKKPKGFAAISPERRKEIARLGGLAISRGKKGREHMSAIGESGGRTMHKTHKIVKR